MSNFVSALNGVSSSGFVEVKEVGLSGMITLRGDLTSAAMKAAVKAAVGGPVPKTRKVVFGDTGSVAWMSPDELLLLVPHDQTEAVTATLAEKLGAEHYLAATVSDARAHFRITGPLAHEALAKVMPVDFTAFAPGDFRRSRLAQVAAAVWMVDEGVYELICFRSVAQYVFDVLTTSSVAGSEVGVD